MQEGGRDVGLWGLTIFNISVISWWQKDFLLENIQIKIRLKIINSYFGRRFH
jgi:hypothetical protein